MRSRPRIWPAACLAVILTAAWIAAGCRVYNAVLGGDASFDIPADWATSDATYTTLYSTLGYDSAGPKRVLIRQNDVDAPIPGGLSFYWRLVADDGHVAADGFAQYEATAYGIPLWVADFSDVREDGNFRMSLEGPGVQLATSSFPLAKFVFTRDTLSAFAVEATQVRSAPPELDNGFFDSNTREGSAYNHAGLLLGLLAAWDVRRTAMTEGQRQRVREAIERAADYLLLMSDPATGELAHASPTRPYQGADPDDTVAGARALARYAAVFQRDNAAKADRAYRRASLADTWLLAEAPGAYAPWTRAAVAFDLYRYALDLHDLERAVDDVRAFAPDYDLREMERHGSDGEAHFETMHALWKTVPEHEDRALWEATAARVASQYVDIARRNVFDVVLPAGVGERSPADEWDMVEEEAPPGEGPESLLGNEWLMGRAIDAVYLADMTGESDVSAVASGSLLWITGLNPGAPVERATADDGESPVEAASFVTGFDAPQILTSPAWEWPRESGLPAVLGGFRGGFALDDQLASTGTSIARDGLWLAAIVTLEDYLHRGARAATPHEYVSPTSELSARALAEDGAAVVAVADASGEPVPNARVTGVWTGSIGEGASLEEVTLLVECATSEGGTCDLGLPPPGTTPPAVLQVTNIEAAGRLFAPGEETLPAPLTFDGIVP